MPTVPLSAPTATIPVDGGLTAIEAQVPAWPWDEPTTSAAGSGRRSARERLLADDTLATAEMLLAASTPS
jgi:hypothetical protein